MTDWGAHHLDIAQWAIGELPMHIDGKAKLPTIPNGYNVATDFGAVVKYPSGVEMIVADEGRRGILFQGDRGQLIVNRGVLAGKPVDELKNNPLPRDRYQMYAHDNPNIPDRSGKLDAIVNHMVNFFECIRTRNTPISDVVSQRLSVNTCHLCNISMRLGRPLKWDPQQEQFVGDSEANTWLHREQRKGYEIS
jgi:hypothetical protein